MKEKVEQHRVRSNNSLSLYIIIYIIIYNIYISLINPFIAIYCIYTSLLFDCLDGPSQNLDDPELNYAAGSCPLDPVVNTKQLESSSAAKVCKGHKNST